MYPIHEADEIVAEDLEAAAVYSDHHSNGSLPHQHAERIAKEIYGIVLDDNTMNRIVHLFACSNYPMKQCVHEGLGNSGLI